MSTLLSNLAFFASVTLLMLVFIAACLPSGQEATVRVAKWAHARIRAGAIQETNELRAAATALHRTSDDVARLRLDRSAEARDVAAYTADLRTKLSHIPARDLRAATRQVLDALTRQVDDLKADADSHVNTRAAELAPLFGRGTTSSTVERVRFIVTASPLDMRAITTLGRAA